MSEWLSTGRHTRCPNPECLSIDGLKVRPVLQVTGPASLAGVQLKFSARESWEYRCFDCEATGPAQLKAPQEHGKWVDGLGGEPYD